MKTKIRGKKRLMYQAKNTTDVKNDDNNDCKDVDNADDDSSHASASADDDDDEDNIMIHCFTIL